MVSKTQVCQLSRIIWESPDFEPYLPVSRFLSADFELYFSRFMSVISWIIDEFCYLILDSTL